MGQFLESFITTISGFMQAAFVTVQITVVSLIFASIIGLIIALMKISKYWIYVNILDTNKLSF